MEYNNTRNKSVLVTIALIVFNILIWGIAFFFFYGNTKMLFLCLLAYGFGLRHAVDADHIAAIDAVTRKFMYNNKKYIGVGFFFSIGHSTIVIIMSFLVALGTIFMRDHLANFQKIGTLVGGIVSSLFLLIIALVNFIIFIDAYKSFIALNTGNIKEKNIDQLLSQKGVMSSLFRPLFKFVSRSWHMYFIGFIFGLGFDTSTEVALLGISASQAALNISVWVIMIFPLLFMAGMSLIDTLDGILMVEIYNGALIRPAKKLYYNMIITLFSFSVALFIGLIEGLSLISEKFDLHGGLWSCIDLINNNMAYFGYYILAIFAFLWVISVFISKVLKGRITP